MCIQIEQKCVIFSEKFKQKFQALQLFLDKDNLYHVRNRFDNEKMLFGGIYPVFLPQSLLTNLIILEAHRKVPHAGVNATLTEIRSRYWICRERQIVKRLLRNCVVCKREHKKPLIGPTPGKLPSLRLIQTYPLKTQGLIMPDHCLYNQFSTILITKPSKFTSYYLHLQPQETFIYN